MPRRGREVRKLMIGQNVQIQDAERPCETSGHMTLQKVKQNHSNQCPTQNDEDEKSYEVDERKISRQCDKQYDGRHRSTRLDEEERQPKDRGDSRDRDTGSTTAEDTNIERDRQRSTMKE